jgi:hypothetical protein
VQSVLDVLGVVRGVSFTRDRPAVLSARRKLHEVHLGVLGLREAYYVGIAIIVIIIINFIIKIGCDLRRRFGLLGTFAEGVLGMVSRRTHGRIAIPKQGPVDVGHGMAAKAYCDGSELLHEATLNVDAAPGRVPADVDMEAKAYSGGSELLHEATLHFGLSALFKFWVGLSVIFKFWVGLSVIFKFWVGAKAYIRDAPCECPQISLAKA